MMLSQLVAIDPAHFIYIMCSVAWPSLGAALLLLLQVSVTVQSSGEKKRVRECFNDSIRWREWLYPPGTDVCPVSGGDIISLPVAISVQRHLVDFIFLIECSQKVNTTYIDYFNTALHTLTSALRERAYGSADTSFAVVLYSLEQIDPVIFYIKDLQTIENVFKLKDIVRYSMADIEPADSDSETIQYSNRELNYLAVDKSLQMVNAVLSGEVLMDKNGHFHTIVSRPLANVHVVVGLGLFEKTSDDDTASSNSAITARRNSIEKSVEVILEHMQTMSNFALHFFFGHNIHPAVEFIGSSRFEVRYKDCTHLSKAMTLKMLLDSMSEASSLQAHLLALGRDIHVMKLSALTRTDCILAICPILWSSFDLKVIHINKCRMDDNNSCDSNTYCSPLHGCVREPLLSSTTESSSPDDKVALTGQLVMSHADLVKSAHSSQSTKKGPMENLSILEMADSNAPSFFLGDIVIGKPQTLLWSPDRDFAEKLIKKGKPVILKNSVVQAWEAMKRWNFSYLAQNMKIDTLQLVKCSDDFLTFDPDGTAPLKVNIALPFTERNMSTSSFFSCIQEPFHCSDGLQGHYYFGSVPESLQQDLHPTRKLFRTTRDYKANKQFVWISSAGMITHAHFDQDFNFFVQLIGTKRFTLWPSAQYELMYMYPRVHPLWHKSRINFRSPDVSRFPNFAKARALQVVVEPGDILYVPPYTWHYVETLSPSVSLSTWSHDYDLYSHMNAIYRHDHKFDLIHDSRGQMFALRLYLDMMIHDLYGFNQTSAFFVRLLTNRFSGLEYLFPPHKDDQYICSAAVENQIPTCVHVHGYAKLDMAVVGEHFQALQPEIRDILFQNYVEEITAQVVGVRKMLAFFRYCFLGQEYYITELGDDEHALWDHKSVSDDSSLF